MSRQDPDKYKQDPEKYTDRNMGAIKKESWPQASFKKDKTDIR